MKPRINIVYAHMKPERIDIESGGTPYEIVWTAKEMPHADCVVYLSGYSYDLRLARRRPDVFRILYLCEPLSVYPLHFLRWNWKPFDAVLTCNDLLVSESDRVRYLPIVSYDYPFSAGHGVIRQPEPALPDPACRRTALCQIVGDKYSPIIGQLYSLRRKAARWFHENGQVKMDVYGRPAMKVPCYRGVVDSKLDTMRQYRYALCFENLHHPIWSRGYLTEKMFDCMMADCVPVYYGCANIEDYVPADCFIDFRRFSGFAELDAFLNGLTDDEYLRYVEAIRAFLLNADVTQRYSAHRLYELAFDLFTHPPVDDSWPSGFWQHASSREKTAFVAMAFGLKGYRFVHPFFRVLRRFQS